MPTRKPTRLELIDLATDAMLWGGLLLLCIALYGTEERFTW